MKNRLSRNNIKTDHLGNTRIVFSPRDVYFKYIHFASDFYPYGKILREYVSVPEKYLFTSKQRDEETELDYFGARYYDSGLGKFLAVDPLAHKFPGWSAYNYCLGNPIIFTDPDGRWPFPVNIRSFAPFDWFGGYFMGDGNKRGYTTSSTATSRLAQSFTVDPNKGTVTGLKTSSSPSYHPALGVALAQDDKGSITNLKTKENNDGSNTTSFMSNMAGHNPLVPGSSDINVHTYFSLTENDKAGTLKVHAIQAGDAFPSAETMIADTKGNQLFIGVSPANGNPYFNLPGNNYRPMMHAYFTINMNSEGVFMSVQQGDKKYSTDEWNKMNQTKPTVNE